MKTKDRFTPAQHLAPPLPVLLLLLLLPTPTNTIRKNNISLSARCYQARNGAGLKKNKECFTVPKVDRTPATDPERLDGATGA